MNSISTENRQTQQTSRSFVGDILLKFFLLTETFLGYRERTTRKSHQNVVPQGGRKTRGMFFFFFFKGQSRCIKILILSPRGSKSCSLFLNIRLPKLVNLCIYLLTLFASWFCPIPGTTRLAVPGVSPFKFIAARTTVKAGFFVLQANRGAQTW